MNKRILVMLAVLVALGGLAAMLYFSTQPTVVEETKDVTPIALTEQMPVAPAGKAPSKPTGRMKWIELGPGTVVGVVKEIGTGSALEGVEVSLEAGSPGPNEVLHTKTHADGSFTFEKVTNFDAWLFRAKAKPPLVDLELDGVSVTENRETDLGTVYLAPAFGVPGIVVDEKGDPLPGASVRAVRTPASMNSMDILRLIRDLPTRPTAVDTAVSGPDGKFELRKMPPNRYDFVVEKAEYQIKVVGGLVITPDAANHPLKFVMLKGFRLDGSVTRESGEPVVAAPVVAFHEPNNAMDFNALDKTFGVTDEKGAFHLEGLGGGRYVVAVTPEGEPSVAETQIVVPTKKPVAIVIKGTCSLEGKITGELDKPVPGAQVYALSFAGRQPIVANVRTDSDGHYAFRGLNPGPLQLFLVQAEGFGNYPEDLSSVFSGRQSSSGVTLVPGMNTKDVSLAKGGIVRGVVKEKGTDAPVAGARVELGTPLALFGGNRGVTTGADGRFEITSVPKGSAVLMVNKDGWFQPGVSAQSVLMLMAGRGKSGGGKDTGKGAVIIINDPGEVVERTLELAHGSTLAGTVTAPDGTAVSGAQVSLVMEADGGGMMQALAGLLPAPSPQLTDVQGHYLIAGPPPGQKARIVARAQGYLDGRTEPMSCAPGDAKDGVDVKMRLGATLAGKVHDEQNRPIDGALVRWIPLGTDNNEWSIRWRLRSATPSAADAKGEFRIPNVETGKLIVEVSDPRHLSWMSKDLAAEDGKTSDLDVTLKMGATLDAKILGVDGRPRPGATLNYLHVTDGGQPTFQDTSGEVVADASGLAHAEGLAPGQYAIHAENDGFAPSETQTVEAGGPVVTLQLAKAFSISGVVRGKASGPVAGLEVAAIKRTILPDGKEDADQVANTRTGSAGEFELKNLPAGNYDISVTVGWGVSPRPNIIATTVKDVMAPRSDLVVEAESGLTISGKAVGDGGAPVTGGYVWGQPDKPTSNTSGVNSQIDEEGHFELTGLLPGKYRITVVNGANNGQKTLVVEAGTQDLSVKFGGGGTVRVFVTLDGAPMEGISVHVVGDNGGGNGNTDAEGRAEVKDVAEGTYNVGAWRRNGTTTLNANQQNVQVHTGAPVDVELKLTKQQQ